MLIPSTSAAAVMHICTLAPSHNIAHHHVANTSLYFCLQVLATLGLPVSARDVADLMNRFSASGRGEGESSFLYPRLLESVAEGGGRPKSGDLAYFTHAGNKPRVYMLTGQGQ